MTIEEKQLLLKDLCARLPYQPNVKFGDHEDGILSAIIWKGLYVYVCDWTYGHGYECHLSEVRPYLRPMSSMTEEEKSEWLNGGLEVLKSVVRKRTNGIDNEPNAESDSFSIDWLNEHHFDYRGLIPMGLALEASEEMYRINKRDKRHDA